MADFSWCSRRVATGAALASDTDVDELVAAGITFVLDARAEFDDGPLFAHRVELAYFWNPTEDDGTHKPPEYWKRTLDFALPLLSEPGQRGLFHCAAGVNRGPSNALCVLVAQGWTAEGAEALIRAGRPQVGLAYRADALAGLASLGWL